MTTEPLKSCFPPVWRGDARVLVLGSLPGERSLAESRYYAHPANQFWRLIGETLGAPMPSDYEARLQRLLERRIALWDVIGRARRRGSLDGAIRDHTANDLAAFVESLPELRAIAFNGATSARLGRQALGPRPKIELIDLPSSSPAFTRPFEAKLAAWSVLRRFV